MFKCLKTRKRYDIKFYELNTNLELKESQFLLFLQDAATENAEINGFGPTFTMNNNLGWFLLKYRIELTQYPNGYPYIEIETEPRGASKCFAMRDFTLFNPKGEVIGRINSTWALIDMEIKTMLPVLKVADGFPAFEKRENDLVFNKVRVPDVFKYEKSFNVRFDDLDVNHHANNSNFIAWALEALPYDFRKNSSLRTLDMQFKKDIAINETVVSKVIIDERDTIHLLLNKSTDEELCLLKASWS